MKIIIKNEERGIKLIAAVYKGPGILDLEEVKTPEIESADDILIRVKCSVICGTDIKTFRRGHHAFIPPVILGHEFSGEVVAIGDDVKTCKIGDQVTVPPFINCGDCFYCQKGLFELCKNRTLLSNGSFAEYIKISQAYAEAGLVKLPADINLEEAALAEPLACVINAVEDCDLSLGDNVLVIGAGPMGLLNVLVSQLKGAGHVIVSEPVAERRKAAQQLGTLAVDPTTQDLSSIVQETTKGKGVDILIIAIANTKVVESVLSLVRPGGKVMLFGGFPGSSTLTLDPNLIHYRQVALLGSSGFTTRQFKQAADLIMQRRINVGQLITHRFPLLEIKQAFDLAINHGGLKICIACD